MLASINTVVVGWRAPEEILQGPSPAEREHVRHCRVFRSQGGEVRPDAGAIVEAQIAVLRHRVLDAQGIHIGPGLGLGHAGRSIIDVSDAANQRMFDATGDVCLISTERSTLRGDPGRIESSRPPSGGVDSSSVMAMMLNQVTAASVEPGDPSTEEADGRVLGDASNGSNWWARFAAGR